MNEGMNEWMNELINSIYIFIYIFNSCNKANTTLPQNSPLFSPFLISCHQWNYISEYMEHLGQHNWTTYIHIYI